MIGRKHTRTPRGFTLVELLIVMLIISILSALALSALAAAAQEGKRQRARMQITKIDTLIMEKWNSYRFRQLPIRVTAGTDRLTAARIRLYALRELMRMELPDRINDIYDGVSARTSTNTMPLPSVPALTLNYQRKGNVGRDSMTNQFNAAYEGAECLYLILSEMRDGDRSALSFFSASEIGDLDNDKLKEILDPWGNPIMFLRWAPGYSRLESSATELSGLNIPTLTYSASTSQVPNGTLYPDPFDPLKVDPRWQNNTETMKPFALKPLIYSAGADKEYDLFVDAQSPQEVHYSRTTPPSDPYLRTGAGFWIGTPMNTDGAPDVKYGDNITNHDITLEGQ